MTNPIDSSLLRKYDVPGPRYTSYPTVPVWSGDFGEREYRRALSRLSDGRADAGRYEAPLVASSGSAGGERIESPPVASRGSSGEKREGAASVSRNPSAEALSVYLHLPFCAKRCHYCGCTSLAGESSEAVDGYLDSVERELALLRDAAGGPHGVGCVHWGGGTPNYLDESQVFRALGLIRDAFAVADDAEISLEADPRLGSYEQAAMLREAGFNRISLGVQDTDAVVQRAIGRNQSERQSRRFYAACREAGFESVNLDLVYGLPAQTLESFARTLEVVLELSPDRIACFSYAHVPWARPNQERIDAALLPWPEEKFRLFQQAVETLTAAGYEWIGMDHFARRDDDLSRAYRRRALNRNFMGYTTSRGGLLAVGMSGISDLCGCFAQNTADIELYEQTVEGGGLPTMRGHNLSREDTMRRLVITHIMCNMELPYGLTERDFGVRVDDAFATELERMDAFVEDGFVVMESDRLRVTDMGRFFVRNICMDWDSYLDKKAEKPVFSRTV